MGNGVSIPTDASRTPKIINASYPRTGTLSIAQACAILLDGPACHGGAQMLYREDAYAKKVVELYDKRHDKARVMKLLRELTQGFVVISDYPFMCFIPELCELYPDAQVVYHKRDPVKWWNSMDKVNSMALTRLLGVLFWPVPGWRWALPSHEGLRVTERERWNPVPGPLPNKDSLERHQDWVVKNVPKERMHFIDLHDGWAPFAAILKCEIPKAPFPRVNDMDGAEKIFARMISKSLQVWALYLLGIGSAVYLWRCM